MIQLFEMSKQVGVYHSQVVLNETFTYLYKSKDIFECKDAVPLGFQSNISLLRIIEAMQVKMAKF